MTHPLRTPTHRNRPRVRKASGSSRFGTRRVQHTRRRLLAPPNADRPDDGSVCTLPSGVASGADTTAPRGTAAPDRSSSMHSPATGTTEPEHTVASDIPVDAHYDLVIIGTGSGNSIPGPEFDDMSIAIVEKGAFGGTCLNVGCIPTKMYVYAADVALETARADRLGLDAQVSSVDWPSIVSRVFDDRIDPIASGGEEYRRGSLTPNIDV